MNFDNQVISIIAETKDEFEKALSFFFADKTRATHFDITEKHGLILYWLDPGNGKAKSLPYTMTFETAMEFAWGWLHTAADYGFEPDHDGNNHRGFRVFNEEWTHVDDSVYGIVAVKPTWAMYGR